MRYENEKRNTNIAKGDRELFFKQIYVKRVRMNNFLNVNYFAASFKFDTKHKTFGAKIIQ